MKTHVTLTAFVATGILASVVVFASAAYADPVMIYSTGVDDAGPFSAGTDVVNHQDVRLVRVLFGRDAQRKRWAVIGSDGHIPLCKGGLDHLEGCRALRQYVGDPGRQRSLGEKVET